MSSVDTWDYVIIGAGISGLTIARELRIREKNSRVLILEKENVIGLHGSGRNSGVLHSGVYYPEHSIKAEICASGSKKMAAYCEENSLPINRIGKLIIPTRETDKTQLELLLNRASLNNVTVELLDEKQLKDIEPEAHTATGNALFLPSTSVVDPHAILTQLQNDLGDNNVKFMFQAKLESVDAQDSTIVVNRQQLKYGVLINAAGQHADKIAKMCGVGEQYVILPFRGSYFKLKSESKIHLNHLIYPVPDLSVPFLGVHSVTTINGDIYFGPSAVPALGREHYSGFKGVDIKDASNIMKHVMHQYLINKNGFRRYAHEEIGRFLKFQFTKAVKQLVPRITENLLQDCNKVGIRAQLYDVENEELVMDFLLKRKNNTIHILNAISPAFTSSLGMASKVVDAIQEDA